jgi:hypothetical protein
VAAPAGGLANRTRGCPCEMGAVRVWWWRLSFGVACLRNSSSSCVPDSRAARAGPARLATEAACPCWHASRLAGQASITCCWRPLTSHSRVRAPRARPSPQSLTTTNNCSPPPQRRPRPVESVHQVHKAVSVHARRPRAARGRHAKQTVAAGERVDQRQRPHGTGQSKGESAPHMNTDGPSSPIEVEPNQPS